MANENNGGKSKQSNTTATTYKKMRWIFAHNHLSQIQRNIKSKNETVGRKKENLNLDKDGNIQWKLVKSMNSVGPSMNKQQLNKETPCLQRRKKTEIALIQYTASENYIDVTSPQKKKQE